MEYMEYIKPELLVLVPVLCVIGTALKKTPNVHDWMIPYILTGVSIICCFLWVFGTETEPNIMLAIFTTFAQSIICAGLAVYGHQIVKQTNKSNEE